MIKTNVFIVDDSPVIRHLFRSILEADDKVCVIGEAENGQIAIEKLEQLRTAGTPPHVITLDIEMPVMDGLTALPKIMEVVPRSKVLMVSSLTEKGGEQSLKALSLGAVECICKPLIETADRVKLVAFGEEIKAKVLGLATPSTALKPSIKTVEFDKNSNYNLRKKSIIAMPKALAIGSSTGGPKALTDFLTLLSKKTIAVPIFVTQHMPETFVKLLAKQLTRETGLVCVEAEDGMIAENGKVYIAPGGKHMKIEKNAEGKLTCNHLDSAPENFCKPAVDPMLRSLVDVLDGRLIIAILTGMGSDGLKGCEYAVAKDAVVVAQDKETSIIWGMPGAVAEAGLCVAVEPLTKLPDVISDLSQGKIV